MSLLYVGGERHVFVVDWVPGALSIRQKLSLGEMPSFLCFAPRKRRTFVALEGEDRIAALRVQSTGELEYEDSVSCPGGPAYLSIDPTESWLFSASYGSGEVRVFSIRGPRGLDPAHQTLTTGKWAHSVLSEPGARRVFVANKGTDRLSELDFDPESGLLHLEREHELPQGSGPRHLCFSPRFRRAYVVNENDSTLSVFARRDAGWALHQTLSTLPRPHRAGDTGADVHLSPDERFLYVSNRGHDSIASFACDAEGVSSLSHFACGGKIPRNFCLLGRSELLVAHQESRSLSRFTRDPDFGHLSLLDTVQLEERAFWIGPAPLRGAQ